MESCCFKFNFSKSLRIYNNSCDVLATYTLGFCRCDARLPFFFFLINHYLGLLPTTNKYTTAGHIFLEKTKLQIEKRGKKEIFMKKKNNNKQRN